VTSALLRLDTDTRAARIYKEWSEARGTPPGPEAIARRLGFSAADVPRRVAVARERAGVALTRAGQAGIGCLTAAAVDYPPLLTQIPDPPIVLWCVGRADRLAGPAVAVVGARQASRAGLDMARTLGAELAAAGLVVISGLARGIDGAAHEGALGAGGTTVAVLGCGVDVTYPPEHRDLMRRISDTGAVISEFPPGAPPLPNHFPLRNRIISGLSHAVVVVEASERSGSLITAKAALEQGRDVLAVPGPVAAGRNRGGHALIKDGARLVETVEDVLEEIGWSAPGGRHTPLNQDNSPEISALETAMDAGTNYSLDDLALATGRGAADLLAELADLELAGRVVRVGSGNFAKLDDPRRLIVRTDRNG
jgi:DNA processing protein